MSQMGHSRRFRDVGGMSALHPKLTLTADIQVGGDVPDPDISVGPWTTITLACRLFANPPRIWPTLRGATLGLVL